MDAAPADPPSGDPPLPFCQRCRRRIDQASIGARVGLCHCNACQLYACRWCWKDAAGECPGCGAAFGGAEFAVAGAGGHSAPAGRRPDRRIPVAVGVVVLAVAAFAVILASPFQPAGGVAGASDTPAKVIIASPTPGLSPRPSPTGASPGGAGVSAAPSRVPAAATPVATGTTPFPPGAARSSPKPTPRPAPTPRRTPAATPAPTPTPVCEAVPNLVGLTVADARAAWTAAGFTGAFGPGNGHDRQTVLTQSEAAGACRPAATAITVTY